MYQEGYCFCLLLPQYVGLSCPVVALRAISDLSRRSFSEDGSWDRYTLLHFRFIRLKKQLLNFTPYVAGELIWTHHRWHPVIGTKNSPGFVITFTLICPLENH